MREEFLKEKIKGMFGTPANKLHVPYNFGEGLLALGTPLQRGGGAQ
jgi:hypothetical protein